MYFIPIIFESNCELCTYCLAIVSPARNGRALGGLGPGATDGPDTTIPDSIGPSADEPTFTCHAAPHRPPGQASIRAAERAALGRERT